MLAIVMLGCHGYYRRSHCTGQGPMEVTNGDHQCSVSTTAVGWNSLVLDAGAVPPDVTTGELAPLERTLTLCLWGLAKLL